MANEPKILLFHMNNDRQRSIEKLCRSLTVPIKVINIRPAMYSQTIGYLAGITGFDRCNTLYSGNDLDSEMLVFSGVDSDLMDEFINRMKQTGIPKIALKAVITPTNIFWTPHKLYDHLCQEHRTMNNILQ